MAGKTCKKVKSKKGYKGNPWWTEECGIQVKKRTRLRRRMQRNRTYETIRDYRIQNRLTEKNNQESIKRLLDKSSGER